jgi:phosphohistidine phosphatase SixA
MAKRSDQVHQMLAEHRARVDRIVARGNVAPVRKLYEAAIVEMQQKLAHLLVTGGGDTFSAHNLRTSIEQLRAGVAHMTVKVGASLALTTRETQVEGLRDVSTNIARLESVYSGSYQQLPIEQAARFLGAIDRNQTSLLASHQSCLSRYGASLIGQAEQALALSMATGATHFETLKRVEQVMKVNWWQAERIARTESAWAYNAAYADGLRIAAQDLPDIYQRWTEHIDDATGRAYDNRVASDSRALHGQIARPDGHFVMPAASDVSAKVWGKTWTFPPNRPNDRSCLTAWRPHWTDVPAYMMQGGARVQVTDEMRRAMGGKAAPGDVAAPVATWAQGEEAVVG